MAFEPSKWIWKNGEMVAWDDARIHVLSHVVHYGSSIFEGIRCYDTPAGPAVFRLREHMERFLDSARVYRMDLGFGVDELVRACERVVSENDLRGCYIRPVAFRGYGSIGVNPLPCPVEVYIAAWEWGAYLGDGALENGIDVQVSSWNRLAPNTMPAMAKAGANYANSQLIKMEAIKNGYAEAIALDTRGYISEGSGENLFVVRDGAVLTPPLGASILTGITRDAVIRLLRDADVPVTEGLVPREMLYLADELFFSGTAAEITPIRSVDKIQVGAGGPGPITRRVQQEYLEIARGQREDRHGWLHPVPVPA